MSKLFVGFIGLASACISLLNGFQGDWFVNPEEFLTSQRTLKAVSGLGLSSYSADLLLVIPNNESSLHLETNVLSDAVKYFRFSILFGGEQWHAKPSIGQLNWTINKSMSGAQHLTLVVDPLWSKNEHFLEINSIRLWSCSEAQNWHWLWSLAIVGACLAFVIVLVIVFYRPTKTKYQDLVLEPI